jgi:hypothetical protein
MFKTRQEPAGELKLPQALFLLGKNQSEEKGVCYEQDAF